MIADRDRVCGILLGLAVVAVLPRGAYSAEMKRLPPVESQQRSSEDTRAPGRQSPAVDREVRQSIWLEGASPAADAISTRKTARPVELVNWNEEPHFPPVEVEGERAPGVVAQAARPSPSRPVMQFVSQQPLNGNRETSIVAKQDTVPERDSEATTPSPELYDSDFDTEPSGEETVQPGTPFLDDANTEFETCDYFDTYLPPCWTLHADAVMLFRSDTRRIKFVEHGTGAAVRGQRPALVTTDDLDPNPAWGPRFRLSRYFTDVHNLEIVYFGMHHWQSQAAFNGINGPGFSFNNIDVPFNANITSDFDGAQYISGDYASKINNAEANLVTNNRWDLNASTGFPWYHYADFLAGFRYFRLSEEFDLRSTDAGETSDYLIDTVNDLVGGQLGVIFGTYHSPRLSWKLESKGGVYANFGRQSTLMRDDDNTVLFRDFVTEGREIAFIGDMDFHLKYDWRPNASLTAGYYLLYVGGVALAPEQLDFTTTATSGSGINQNGGAFYHGPSVGLEIVF